MLLRKKNKTQKHYLYLLVNEEQNIWKLGYTTNPRQRLKSYITHNPLIKVIGIFDIPNKDYERKVNKELSHKGLGGYSKMPGQKEWRIAPIPFSVEVINIIDRMEVDEYSKSN